MNNDKRHEMFVRLSRTNPSPTTELEFDSPFELLAAVLLSAQATDVSVNLATRKLFPVANTPKSILDLGVEGVESYIRTIGLFRSKAKHLIQTCQILIDQHDSQVPQNREALEQLPGVGRKTANVILNTAFGQPTIAVDTHIFRVSNRTGLARGDDVLAVEKRLLKVVPESFRLNAHHWLILHGRYICKARKPECWRCEIIDLCDFKPKIGDPADKLPARKQAKSKSGANKRNGAKAVKTTKKKPARKPASRKSAGSGPARKGN